MKLAILLLASGLAQGKDKVEAVRAQAEAWRAEHRTIDLHQHINPTTQHLARAVKIMDAAGGRRCGGVNDGGHAADVAVRFSHQWTDTSGDTALRNQSDWVCTRRGHWPWSERCGHLRVPALPFGVRNRPCETAKD